MTLINQLIQWYHLEPHELDDIENYLQSHLRQINLRKNKKQKQLSNKVYLVNYHCDNCNDGESAYTSVFSTLEKAKEFFHAEVYSTVHNEIQSKNLIEQFNNYYKEKKIQTEDGYPAPEKLIEFIEKDVYECDYTEKHFWYREPMDCNEYYINIEEATIDDKTFISIK